MPLFNFVKSNLSILDIIGEYVQLRPAGSYWKGSCPFHQEKDASFTVSPDKQIYYCFGCHSGGDLIAFVAKAENLSQLEAVKYLIDQYKLQIPDSIKQDAFNQLGKNSDQKDKYFNLCKAVSVWANEQLLKTHVSLKYLTDRSIDLDQIKYFDVGYFPGGIRNINNFLKKMAEQNFLAKDLIEAGVLMEGRSVLYSPFEERIIFPIKDTLARNCGFGGRVFKLLDQRAKYYNSKESAWFSKGKLLFGFDLAKKEMQNKSCAYLVEGYTDCVAMTKHGYKNTIATLGTACTHDHLKILSRYIQKLYVLYDGDAAGQKAILRLTQLCWDVNLELQIIKLPSKEDPASFLNKKGDLNGLIEQSSDIFTFFVQSLGNDFFNSSFSEKLGLSEKIIQVVAKINDAFKQELLLQQASSAMQVPFSSLKELLFKQQNKGNGGYYADDKACESNETPIKAHKKNSIPLVEERIFSAIINSIGKTERFYVEKDLLDYFSDYIQFLLHKLEEKDFDVFLNGLDESDRSWVIACSLKYEQKVSRDLFDQLIFHFCKKNWRQIVQDMKLKLRNAGQEGDPKKLKELFVLFSKLKEGLQSRGLI